MGSIMAFLTILACHVLLCSIALSSPVVSKPVEAKSALRKSNPDVTTQPPLKTSTKNLNSEQVQNVNYPQTEKPATKKRDVPDILSNRNEYLDEDFYEGRPTDDYDGIHALKAYLDNARREDLIESDKYRGNNYRYFDDESRRKRTAVYEGFFNRPENYYEPEIQLTPEDIMALNAYRQQQRLYKSFPYGRWNDINNSLDVQENDLESDEVYDRPENFFDRYYDQRYQNWANLPRNDKIIPNRRRRSFLGNPKIRVPLYRRAIL